MGENIQKTGVVFFIKPKAVINQIQIACNHPQGLGVNIIAGIKRYAKNINNGILVIGKTGIRIKCDTAGFYDKRTR